jgi:hypothetical protein
MDLGIPPYSNALPGVKVILFEEPLPTVFFQFLQLQGDTHSNNRMLGKPSSFFRRNKHIPCRLVQVGVGIHAPWLVSYR